MPSTLHKRLPGNGLYPPNPGNRDYFFSGCFLAICSSIFATSICPWRIMASTAFFAASAPSIRNRVEIFFALSSCNETSAFGGSGAFTACCCSCFAFGAFSSAWTHAARVNAKVNVTNTTISFFSIESPLPLKVHTPLPCERSTRPATVEYQPRPRGFSSGSGAHTLPRIPDLYRPGWRGAASFRLHRKHSLALDLCVPIPRDAGVVLVSLDRPTFIALVQFDLLVCLVLLGESTKGRSSNDQSFGENVRRVGQPIVGLSHHFCQPLNIGHFHYLHRSSTMSGIQSLPGILFFIIETREKPRNPTMVPINIPSVSHKNHIAFMSPN